MNKQHIPIIIGIALPVILMIVVAITVAVNRGTIQPTHDFIYAMHDQTDYDYRFEEFAAYSVVDNKLTATTTATYPDLYRYDVSDDTVNKITFEEAQTLLIDDSRMSEDGYLVEYDYGRDNIFEIFGSYEDDNGYVLRKGNAQKSITIPTVYRWSDDMIFIGWIK